VGDIQADRGEERVITVTNIVLYKDCFSFTFSVALNKPG